MHYRGAWAEPAASVVDALRGATDALALCAGGLPSALTDDVCLTS